MQKIIIIMVTVEENMQTKYRYENYKHNLLSYKIKSDRVDYVLHRQNTLQGNKFCLADERFSGNKTSFLSQSYLNSTSNKHHSTTSIVTINHQKIFIYESNLMTIHI